MSLPGSYSLTFNDNGFVTQVVSSASVSAGNTTTQNAALAEAGSISGKVTDASTLAAVANATITCSCLTGGSATSDINGNYTLANVPPGSGYSVTFNATGYQTKIITGVSVTANTVTTENAALSAQLGGITGTVTELTHAVLRSVAHPSRARVVLHARARRTANPTVRTRSLTSLLGRTISSPPLAGIQPPLNHPRCRGNDNGTLSRLRLRPTSGSISGTVSDSITGLPITGATVACSGTPTCTSATTASNGTYTIGSLTEGTYQLMASKPNYTSSSTTPVVVVPGGTTTQTLLAGTNSGDDHRHGDRYGYQPPGQRRVCHVQRPAGLHRDYELIRTVITRSRWSPGATRSCWPRPATPRPRGPPRWQ